MIVHELFFSIYNVCLQLIFVAYFVYIENYLHDRYFPRKCSQLAPITRQFGKYNGSVYNVGLDAHEVKLHSKFQSVVDNKHTHLLNATGNKNI